MNLHDAMNKAVENYNPVLGHMIKNEQGDLRRITTSEVMAKYAIVDGREVCINARVSDFLDSMEPCAAREIMDSETWDSVAPKLAKFAEQIRENMKGVDWMIEPRVTHICTPLDWPAELVEGRQETLQKVFDPRFDLPAYVEINELCFANQHGREPRADLFSEGSVNSTWKNMKASSDEDLLTELQMINEREGEIASEKALHGDGPVGSARESQISRMVEQEIEYVLDQRHPKKSVSLTDDELEYGPCMEDPNCPF